ncbi:MAG TPA: hypothetical protein VN646_16910 [Candidatus Acidoferrum sp.]|nr:hypothetical protein [Candidatus Acidoferrum sp.]
MQPTIGRSVHFRAPTEQGGETYAAIITVVHEADLVSLVTFGPRSVYFHERVARVEAEKAADSALPCWFWPPLIVPSASRSGEPAAAAVPVTPAPSGVPAAAAEVLAAAAPVVEPDELQAMREELEGLVQRERKGVGEHGDRIAELRQRIAALEPQAS